MIQYRVYRTAVDCDTVGGILFGAACRARPYADMPYDDMGCIQKQGRSCQVGRMVLDRNATTWRGLPGDSQISRFRLDLGKQFDRSANPENAGPWSRCHHACAKRSGTGIG